MTVGQNTLAYLQTLQIKQGTKVGTVYDVWDSPNLLFGPVCWVRFDDGSTDQIRLSEVWT